MFVPLTPLRCLHRAVDLFGSKIGVVSGDRQFTYAQFGERCEKIATALPELGIASLISASTTISFSKDITAWCRRAES
jgi:non-ribosomal peptide synthetase component E (peptide arylation enzyme)